MSKIAAAAGALLVAAVLIYFAGAALTAPPPDARAADALHPENDPLQQDLAIDEAIPLEIPDGQVRVVPKAAFDTTAKLCGRQRYWRDWSAAIAPYDACLAWGRLATENLKGKVVYSQGGRWYQFRTAPDSPVDPAYVSRHSANTHLIATDAKLRRAIARLEVGEIVEFTGYLVQLAGKYKGADVWWNSSLTREDTGAGSCELLYVTSVRQGDKVWGKPLTVR